MVKGAALSSTNRDAWRAGCRFGVVVHAPPPRPRAFRRQGGPPNLDSIGDADGAGTERVAEGMDLRRHRRGGQGDLPKLVLQDGVHPGAPPQDTDRGRQVGVFGLAVGLAVGLTALG